ncbi:putative kinase [Phaeobacter piscinae]|uniref:Kinase n=1 Tax=Phaeobacter piscinae TaxID=1580596 RepID=A0AAN1GRU8_9RHOB|nr:ATP-binding protein [Phaeobacter piscinae]ATG44053.1 putative kinase [Phaeobacter piscinae]AUR36363.1 putative kinase [Phaeobacter piscinae]
MSPFQATSSIPTLHMLCGKIAAGKSTLAARLATDQGTILLAEDDWLHALFADQMSSPADYLRCAEKLRGIMSPHVASLLQAGVSVVLDFPANTVDSRAWMRSLIDHTGAAHKLHLLDVPDELCLARLRARNAAGAHPFAATEAQFHAFSRHFTHPAEEEGFTVVVHRAAE